MALFWICLLIVVADGSTAFIWKRQIASIVYSCYQFHMWFYVPLSCFPHQSSANSSKFIQLLLIFFYDFALFSIPYFLFSFQKCFFCHYWILRWLFFGALARPIILYVKLVVFFLCALSRDFLHWSSCVFSNCHCTMKSLPSSSQPGLILRHSFSKFYSLAIQLLLQVVWICWAV